MAEIRLAQVEKRFEAFTALEPTSLTVEHGHFFVLLGPSGCGKTTTLRMIAGLELPTSGQVLVDGRDVTTARAAERDIAFVFQMYALYPHLSVRDNLAYPLRSQGVARTEVRDRVIEVARLLRIEPLLAARPSALSSGDRQRVALGRAIIRRPKAFLMDEPLGALDTEFRELMSGELRALHERIGATTVYVTHDQIEAMTMADRITVMNRGRVEQIGTPAEVYHRPASMFVAGFIGSPAMNFLPTCGPVTGGATTVPIEGAEIQVPALARGIEHGEAMLGVRPEHVRPADEGPLRGRIYGVEYMGARQLLTVDTSAGRLKVRTANTIRTRPGETIGLAFDPDAVVLFDGRTGTALTTPGSTGSDHG